MRTCLLSECEVSRSLSVLDFRCVSLSVSDDCAVNMWYMLCVCAMTACVLTEDFLVSGVAERLLLPPAKSLYSFSHPRQSMLRYICHDIV